MSVEGNFQVGNRTITYLEVGDPGGALVLHNHGGPSSRLEAALFDIQAKANGLRLVCADRPGIGGSDLQPGRTFESWTDDLVALADSLGAEQFAVTGWSEGGPWALAAAAYIDPARLLHVACIGGASYGAFGANWAAHYLSSVDALGGRLALHFHPGFTLMYEVLGMSAKHFADSYGKTLVKSVNDADRAVLGADAVMQPFLDASRECFRYGADGLVKDATMLYAAWPFDMTAVTRPMHFWQGSADTLVPEAINKAVVERTPGAVWHPISGGGHFIAVSHADDILALAANDLAIGSARVAVPPVPAPDDKDWTWVLETLCPECGFDASAVGREAIAATLLATTSRWQSALRRKHVRDRPSPTTWSILEYGCHIRDVHLIFGQRINLILDQDNPGFANWDQDRTAVEKRYWTADPDDVAQEIEVACRTAAAAFTGLSDEQWSRVGRRSNGSIFTTETLGRYYLHDVVHHLRDIDG